MRWGVLSGALWGLDTVVLGVALAAAVLAGAGDASLVGAALHDVCCALILLTFMGVRGRLADTWAAVRTRAGAAVVAGALLGGPIGMTGYLVSIASLGPGYTAIISTFYPAVGTVLARVLLHERMRIRQLAALAVALGAILVAGWQSAGGSTPDDVLVGAVGALACVLGWGSEAVILAWGMRDDAVDNQTALHIRQTTSGLAYALVVVPAAGAGGLVTRTALTPTMGIIAVAAAAGTASYLCYYRAIAAVGASRAMALNISYSAWAVVFALVLTAVVPSPLQVVCCLVILVGTVLAATPDWESLLDLRRCPQPGCGADGRPDDRL